MREKKHAKRADGRVRIIYHGIAFYGKDEAEAREKRDEYKKAELLGLKRDGMTTTFAQYAGEWLPLTKGDASERAYSACAYHLNKAASVFGNKPLASITQTDIKVLHSQYKGYSQGYINAMCQAVHGVFSSAMADGLILRDPTFAIKRPRGKSGTHRALETWERQVVYAAASAPDASDFCYAAAIMMLAGLRRGEVAALRWEDIDFEKRIIHVYKNAQYQQDGRPITKGTKTKAGMRDVPLFNALYDVLPQGRNGHIILTRKSKEYSASGIEYAVHQYLRRCTDIAGCVVDFKAHDLRHTFATMLYELGIPIKQASKWLGHANESITLRLYTHLSQMVTREAVDQVNSRQLEAISGHYSGQSSDKPEKIQ